MKNKAASRPFFKEIWKAALTVLLLFVLYPVYASGGTSIYLREKGTNKVSVQVQPGDTVAIEVVVKVGTVESQGVAFFITFDDDYFSIVDQGSDTLTRPFNFTGGCFGDGWSENNTHGDPGNDIDKFQLDGSIVKGGSGYVIGEGVVATFYLAATSSVESSLVNIDYDKGNSRDTRLHVLNEGSSPFDFRNYPLPMYISVGTTTGIGEQVNRSLPAYFSLSQNYPNPFNPETVISYSLPVASQVLLRIYNTVGQVVRTLMNGSLPAGTHSVRWDGCDDRGMPVSSGVYIYNLNAGSQQISRKMLLIR